MDLSKANAQELEQLRAFVAKYRGKLIQSTSARVIDYADVLYNVTGSTKDPKAVKGYKGHAWKGLLNKYSEFSGTSCYVTNPLTTKAPSHPGFNVGGHMTPNQSGVVEYGGNSYLMPLCYWHNSTRRNRTAFSHSKTKVLELSGYMEGDTAFTFEIRLGIKNTHTLLFLDPDSNHWTLRELNNTERQDINNISLKSKLTKLNIQEYLLIEKRDDSRYKKSWKSLEVGVKE